MTALLGVCRADRGAAVRNAKATAVKAEKRVTNLIMFILPTLACDVLMVANCKLFLGKGLLTKNKT